MTNSSDLCNERATMAQEEFSGVCCSTTTTSTSSSKPVELSDSQNSENAETTTKMTFIAKFGKEKITLSVLPPSTTLASIKSMLQFHTRVLPIRQKLIGLAMHSTTGASSARKFNDDVTISELKVKKSSNAIECILVGTPEEHIFVDPGDRDDLPEVIDDFDFDFTAGSELWERHVANQDKLQASIRATTIHVMNQPRPGYPLLVLDLDHTLLDFSSNTLLQSSGETAQQHAEIMKRPYMDQFLTRAYRHYDLVVWSQTSWRWLETKLIELAMLSHPGYRFCFVLDKTSMFPITSMKKRTKETYSHHVKPLQLIWTKFPYWGVQNTVHVDDLTRNFALNMENGLRVNPFHRKKVKARTRDVELEALSIYLERLAVEARDRFHLVDLMNWMDVVTGAKNLTVRKGVEGKDT